MDGEDGEDYDSINEIMELLPKDAGVKEIVPNVSEPDNIFKAYMEYKTIWEPKSVLKWEEWFGKSQANLQRYHRSVDTFRYIDRVIETGTASGEDIAAKLTKVAHKILGDKPRSTRDFVKNCMYFYFHPPKSADPKRPPKCTSQQLESAIAEAGLPALG